MGHSLHMAPARSVALVPHPTVAGSTAAAQTSPRRRRNSGCCCFSFPLKREFDSSFQGCFKFRGTVDNYKSSNCQLLCLQVGCQIIEKSFSISFLVTANLPVLPSHHLQQTHPDQGFVPLRHGRRSKGTKSSAEQPWRRAKNAACHGKVICKNKSCHKKS